MAAATLPNLFLSSQPIEAVTDAIILSETGLREYCCKQAITLIDREAAALNECNGDVTPSTSRGRSFRVQKAELSGFDSRMCLK